MKHLILLSFLFFAFAGAGNVFAQSADDPSIESRQALAEQMNEIRPLRQQLESAVDKIAGKLPEKDRKALTKNILSSVDDKKLETVSVDAMVEIFTEAELKRMVDYFGSDEAQSISKKLVIYQGMIQPEIVKMLDKALMEARIGKSEIKP